MCVQFGPSQSDSYSTYITLRRLFYLLLNSQLVQKEQVPSHADLRDIHLKLGKLYKLEYRRPYYFAGTYTQFGESKFAVQDVPLGTTFQVAPPPPEGFKRYYPGP